MKAGGIKSTVQTITEIPTFGQVPDDMFAKDQRSSHDIPVLLKLRAKRGRLVTHPASFRAHRAGHGMIPAKQWAVGTAHLTRNN